jgi:hypothetical protein
VQREAISRKVAADFIGSAHDACYLDGKTARAALREVVEDDGAGDDDTATGRMWERALQSTPAKPLPPPEKVIPWNKPIERVTEADAREFRRRDAAYSGNNSERHDKIAKLEEREKRHEQGTDGRGVMSSEAAAALDAAEAANDGGE